MTSLSDLIDITITDERWSTFGLDLEALTQRAVSAACTVLDRPHSQELSIALINDEDIAALNRDYRGKDKPTNVLSFPSDGHNPVMGDIVLAFETVEQEAKARGIDMADHLTHLLIHGYLHLCGYDHEKPSEAEAMESLEIIALAALGIDSPYDEGANRAR